MASSDHNIGLQIFIVLIILISLGIVGLLIYTSIQSIQLNSSNQGGSTGSVLPCSETVSYSSLYQIDKNTPICYSEGINKGQYYIGCNSDYNYVVSTYQNSPEYVCNGYCDTLINGVCTGSEYNGNDAQTNYNNCLKQLSGTNCIPPVPIAISGTILYYASSVTSNSCSPPIVC